MIYMLFTDGFEEIEAIEPLDILKRCGGEVKMLGVSDINVTGSHGVTVRCDMLINQADLSDADAIILPGGPGHKGLDTEYVKNEVLKANDKGIIVAAICAAPSILGGWGILKGKKATCFPGFEGMLLGAELSGEKCVTDGNIITAKGAGAAADFGFALAKKLFGDEKAAEIKAAMQY